MCRLVPDAIYTLSSSIHESHSQTRRERTSGGELFERPEKERKTIEDAFEFCFSPRSHIHEMALNMCAGKWRERERRLWGPLSLSRVLWYA